MKMTVLKRPTLSVQFIDDFINQQRQELTHLEFDDPEFDRVNLEIIEAYQAIARGESHVVPF